MCGIFGLVRTGAEAVAPTAPLRQATEIVRHRGPDDEGYVLWAASQPPRVHAGPDTTEAARSLHRLLALPEVAEWRVGLVGSRIANGRWKVKGGR